MTDTPLDDAKSIFGSDWIGADAASAALGFDVRAAVGDVADSVPFDRELLMRAADEGRFLVLRVARDLSDAPLSIVALAARLACAAGVEMPASAGSAWFAREPFALQETCRPGWALVAKSPIEETRNLTYAEQDEALRAKRGQVRLPLRRRTAVEIVYDTLLFAAARGERLLESDWDWSSTAASDGALVTAGELGPTGLKLVAYSRAVRFRNLGVCVNCDPT